MSNGTGTSINTSSSTYNAYITYVHPILIDNRVCWDIFYVSDKTDLKQQCIRIYDVELEFMLARLPGMNEEYFKHFVEYQVKTLKNVSDVSVDISFINNLVDASYFSPFNNRTYAVFRSKDCEKLNKLYKQLFDELKYVYHKVTIMNDTGMLNLEDKLFYDNVETPFRFTSSTLSLSKTVYNLSCKYNIPLIGGISIDDEKLDVSYPQDLIPTNVDKKCIRGMKFKDFVNGGIKRNNEYGGTHLMTLLAYDIETYNPDGNLDPNIENNYIICIGIGVFKMTEQAPFERVCLIWKDIKGDNKSSRSADGKRMLEDFESESALFENRCVEERELFGRKCYKVIGEYDILNKSDITNYVICKNEKDLLECYIQVLNFYHPHVITGFNTFGFDDKYVWARMCLHQLENEYLQCFSIYDNEEVKELSWYRPFKPTFKQFDLKIDGEARHDNETVRALAVQNVDVYKLMLKEDPKRFTQYGRGNLNTMLEVYGVKNPFIVAANKRINESESLIDSMILFSKNDEKINKIMTEQNVIRDAGLQKTDLKINEMFRRWRENENIYSIALYCTQDAWITGTLLIKRSKLTDLIEMAGISNTSFSDSLYRADGVRVANAILGYAYNEGFALMDTPFEFRNHDEKCIPFGLKSYDERTIVGGAVKNIHAGRQKFICALDYSAMYPSSKEGTNVDSSAKLDERVLKDPEAYGLQVVRKLNVNDIYGEREVFYIRRI